MDEKRELASVKNIRNRVYVIRGQQVMLDSDLAELYGYEVKKLNQQVKRNIERFPEDFMFQINENELRNLRSQFVTANINNKSRSMPYVFTEQGVYMLATVLRGELAKHQSIYVVDNYMNAKSLQLLSQKKQNVEVILFTENGHGKKGFLTKPVVEDFGNQYPPLRIKPNPDSHDRWIVIDYGLESEQVFHCGASSKDAGGKVCAISKIESSELVHPMVDALLQNKDILLQ